MLVFLSRPDRERYGIESADGLQVDLSVVMQDEAEELDDYGIDPDEWEKFINSRGVKVWRAVVWLALVRNGVDVKLAEVKFNRRATRYLADPSPGKDESPSETNDSNTPPLSSPDSGSP